MNSEIERLDFGSDPSWETVKRQFFNTGNRIAIAFDDRKGGRIQVSEAALNALRNPMYGLVLINPKRHQLMLMGSMVTINDVIDFDTAFLVAEECHAKVEREVVVTIEERIIDDSEDTEENLVSRSPVVYYPLRTTH